jgi:hypothetical protein
MMVGFWPMGMPGGLANAPDYLLQQAQNNVGLAAQAGSRCRISVSARDAKVHKQIAKLIDALPMAIAMHIASVDFYVESKDEPANFTIVFDNRRTLVFEDINEFPSDAHIARIALDCP